MFLVKSANIVQKRSADADSRYRVRAIITMDPSLLPNLFSTLCVDFLFVMCLDKDVVTMSNKNR